MVFGRIFHEYGPQEVIEEYADNEYVEIDDEVTEFFTKICDRHEELDLLIGRHLKNWKLPRISKVSLAILRVAFYELLYKTEIDMPVVINEAVELCKKYSVTDDASFVNGVLGTYVKQSSSPSP